MTLAFLDGRVQTRVTGLSTAVTTILQADEPTDALRVASVEFAGDRLATASLLFGSVPLATGLEVPQRVISRETPLHLIGSQQLRASASSTSVSAIVSYVRLPGQVEAVELATTLYFDGAIDDDWETVGNWWFDDAFSQPAGRLPASIDSVVAVSSVLANGGTIANFTMSDPTTALPILTGTLTVTGVATFNNASRQDGTLVGNAIFNNTSRNTDIIDGNATFNDNSQNQATVTGNATFNDNAFNDDAVTGDATFNDNSQNYGAVNGTATFTGSACNNGGQAGTFVPNPPPEC